MLSFKCELVSNNITGVCTADHLFLVEMFQQMSRDKCDIIIYQEKRKLRSQVSDFFSLILTADKYDWTLTEQWPWCFTVSKSIINKSMRCKIEGAGVQFFTEQRMMLRNQDY